MEDRRPGDGQRTLVPDPLVPDPLVGEIQREHRDRRVLVIAAPIAIIAGPFAGLAVVLGALDDPSSPGGWLLRGRGALLAIVAPPLVSMAIGYAIYVLRRRRRTR